MFPSNYTTPCAQEPTPVATNATGRSTLSSSSSFHQLPAPAHAIRSNTPQSITMGAPLNVSVPVPSGTSSYHSTPNLSRSSSNQQVGIPPPMTPNSISKSVSAATLESSGARSYLGSNFSNSSHNSIPQVGPCGSCGCTEFTENVFKKGQCNNCFHPH
jgi:hypothetical protein